MQGNDRVWGAQYQLQFNRMERGFGIFMSKYLQYMYVLLSNHCKEMNMFTDGETKGLVVLKKESDYLIWTR